MPITLENISARPSRQTLKIKGIGTRDTMQYLSALGGTYQDAIFNEQTSNLPDEYIRLDEMARDEKQYNLNIYEFERFQRIIPRSSRKEIMLERYSTTMVGWQIRYFQS
ncbi:DUF4765 family protein [Salmonella enterica]|nr:DUF4765 family protein [Salmonella enterica]EDX5494294.1 DUF4765 family protein [Salmonella enterica subsp. arizonae]EBT7483023.1 DUF4765 family protein [Salmonella enterica]EHX7633223.1 DUF4765 family protein [Salmonella enterica]EJE5201514.1 DUF4765 family protein [Salmonella enterica]